MTLIFWGLFLQTLSAKAYGTTCAASMNRQILFGQTSHCSSLKFGYLQGQSPFSRIFRVPKSDHRKLIAACMAFPLPFGFLGGHRLFLGTKPYIPIVYVGTLGGCLGAIPLVDFFVILFTKDLDQYMNNPKVFMWVK